MRTSLAIACLAGVALASKSKSYHNKHTAERPAGDCLTLAASRNMSEDDYCNGIWEAWNSQCMDTMDFTTWTMTDECYQANDDVLGVPDQAPAPEVACDDGFGNGSADQKCNDQWYAFDKWCRWWNVPEDQKKVCDEVNAAFWARHVYDHDTVVMQKTQMQEKHSLQQKKRAGKKQAEIICNQPRPTGKCLNIFAYNQVQDDECDNIWWFWNIQCAVNWTDECDEAENDIWGVPDSAPAPEAACDIGYFYESEDQVCNKAWEAFDDMCNSSGVSEDQKKLCDEVNDAYQARSKSDEALVVMQKTTMQRKHELKKSAAGKHALKKTAAKERSGKKASVNLAASSSAANDSQYASGVAMGAAVGAAAALGALFAISKCNKGRVDDFQRV